MTRIGTMEGWIGSLHGLLEGRMETDLEEWMVNRAGQCNIKSITIN